MTGNKKSKSKREGKRGDGGCLRVSPGRRYPGGPPVAMVEGG